MTDIVNRLREVAEIETGLLYSRRQLLKDAADEITRLRSEHDAWRFAALEQQERLKRSEAERDAAKAMCDEMAKALEDISFGRGSCASCGKLADMPRNWVGCDENNGHDCRWVSRDPAPVAIAALAAYRKAQEVGNV
ncbi:hypothetical protein [Rhizobium rhizogenes]|uniref:hypothetical protein n=1 Tax=Rhizobium rhizogenes TaxID=359 RepID=UPI0024BE8E3B|nr:hypothetical protein [Rhizobium rhizogenes]MDJ1632304.1 hypothetical protein [Rhizobium rhizogenes]